jgi:hypothetical protein
MNEMELYIHTQEWVEPKLVKTSQDSTVKQIIELVAQHGCFDGKVDEEILVFIEENDEPIGRHRTLSECEIRHRHHLHLHRCRKVRVSVFYNEEKHESFPPSAKVRRVLKWAINAFKLTPAEAADKILVLKGNTDQELDPDAHIGSFAKPHQCTVELCLTAPVEING